MGAVAASDARELRARAAEVLVLTPEYPGRPEGVEAKYLRPIVSFGNAAVLPGVMKALKGCDLVHLHYPFYGTDIFVALWAWWQRKPMVLTYHMQPLAGDWRDLVFKLHRLVLEPFVLRAAKAVCVSSLDYAAAVGLHHKQLIDMPFGIDVQRFTPGENLAWRTRHGVSESATVFIFVGGLDKAHSFKGVDVLLRASAYLSPQTDWRLLIVGDGDMRADYENLVKTLQIADRVIFAGSVSQDELPGLYQAADVHVLPSVSQSEAFGLVTLEAAASGLPSVVSDLPGVRTLVSVGETGLLAEAGIEESVEAALQKFLDDPGLAKRLGDKARERVETEYTLDVLADRLLGVYNRLMS